MQYVAKLFFIDVYVIFNFYNMIRVDAFYYVHIVNNNEELIYIL